MKKRIAIFTLTIAILSLTACSRNNCCDNSGPVYTGNMKKSGTGYSPQPNFNQPRSCDPNSYELN